MFRLALLALYSGSALACNADTATTCIAGLTLPTVDVTATDVDYSGFCTYMKDYFACIGESGCCDDSTIKSGMDSIGTMYEAAPYNCDKLECSSAAAPCFARDTFALSADGASIPMASLRSGDLVMDGPSSFTRVVVNQHAQAHITSPLRKIEHSNGAFSMTPDHVLEVDGAFVAARNVAVGSILGESEVSRVTATAGEIINPLTASGKILTSDGVLASTYPEWIAHYMLTSSLFPLPVSLSNALSYLFPETAQSYYDTVIEGLVTRHHPLHLKKVLPESFVPVAFLVGDLAVSGGFVAYSLASPLAIVATAALIVAGKAARK